MGWGFRSVRRSISVGSKIHAIRRSRDRAQPASAGPAGLARPPPGGDHRARSADRRPTSSSGGATRNRPLPAARIARRRKRRSQHHRDRLSRMAVDVPRPRPGRAAPGRRGRIRQRRRRDGGERHLRQDPDLRRHCRIRRSDPRRAGRKGAAGDDPGRRRPLSRNAFHHRLASRAGGLGLGSHPPRGSADETEAARGLRAARSARPQASTPGCTIPN